jgi:GNAT superfamily N-acetyltransferase
VIRDLGDGIQLDDDKNRIDVAEVHRFLSEEAYWAIGRPRETVERLIREASRVVGVYDGGRQIGFCRAFTDGLALAYLADVYVLPEYRGRGLGEELVREMVENGPFAHVTWILHTEDMHPLYRKFGFAEPNYKLLERPATRYSSESG